MSRYDRAATEKELQVMLGATLASYHARRTPQDVRGNMVGKADKATIDFLENLCQANKDPHLGTCCNCPLYAAADRGCVKPSLQAYLVGRGHVITSCPPTLKWRLALGRKALKLTCNPDHPYRPELVVAEHHCGVAGVTLIAQLSGKDYREVVFSVRPMLRDTMEDCSVCQGTQIQKNPETDLPEKCWWCRGLGRSVMDEGKEIASALYWSWLRSPNGGMV